MVAVSTYFWEETKPYDIVSALQEAQQQDVSWSPGDENSPYLNARQHFYKHGHEFGFKTEDEYIKAANDFVKNPPAGTVTRNERDGDTVYYNKKLNIFAVRNKEGAPRTFFKPDPPLDGLR